ncbi:GAF domain-containing protein [Planobispora takensis]|uniref:GAF domain-containing protein n=1 Tax=Planobispora takensis TaxID=1367882 RepID=A0A8J3T4K8_9ACTN|nr:GAF domain-containing protein [Planobispora takensis]GII05608.1 hypothetical protein Pta02_76160 [Planobispora takensis]
MNTDMTTLTDLERLSEIALYDLTAPGLREELDDLARRSAERLDCAVGLVTILLDSAQVYIGAHGLPADDWMTQAGGTPAEWAFCLRVVRTGRPYVVTDAPADPRYAGNPLVELAGVRSYAGVPLIGSGGHVLGAHCVKDFLSRSRSYGEAELEVLRQGAEEALTVLSRYRDRHLLAGSC